MPYVETRVGRLFVEERGRGAPIVLWPSFLTDGGLFRHQVEALSASHRTVVIDPPSHGRSEPFRFPFEIEDCAAAVVEVLDALGIERAIVGGLSWGGMTAMRLALARPERVRALVLLDTSACAERRSNQVRYRAMAEVVRRVGWLRRIDEQVAVAMFAPETRRTRPELVAELTRRIHAADPEGIYQATLAVVVRRTSIAPEIGQIGVPTLVGVGEHDVATPLAYAERIAGSIPGAKLVRFPGAGHLAALEAPEAVTRAIVAFVGSLPAA